MRVSMHTNLSVKYIYTHFIYMHILFIYLRWYLFVKVLSGLFLHPEKKISQ